MNIPDDAAEALAHHVQRANQAAHFIMAPLGYPGRQVAGGDLQGEIGGLGQRPHHRPQQQGAEEHQHQQPGDQHPGLRHQHLLLSGLGGRRHGLGLPPLALDQFIDRCRQPGRGIEKRLRIIVEGHQGVIGFAGQRRRHGQQPLVQVGAQRLAEGVGLGCLVNITRHEIVPDALHPLGRLFQARGQLVADIEQRHALLAGETLGRLADQLTNLLQTHHILEAVAIELGQPLPRRLEAEQPHPAAGHQQQGGHAYHQGDAGTKGAQVDAGQGSEEPAAVQLTPLHPKLLALSLAHPRIGRFGPVDGVPGGLDP